MRNIFRATLNKAVKKCDGDYIAILSSHCILLTTNGYQNIWIILKNLDIAAAFGKQLPLPGTSYKI